MRFESATVPAAVMPDRSNDDGFVNYLPLSAGWRMGRLHNSGISQKTCHKILIFKAFGKKSAGSFIDSPLKTPDQPRISDNRVDFETDLIHLEKWLGI